MRQAGVEARGWAGGQEGREGAKKGGWKLEKGERVGTRRREGESSSDGWKREGEEGHGGEKEWEGGWKGSTGGGRGEGEECWNVKSMPDALVSPKLNLIMKVIPMWQHCCSILE